MHFTSSFSVDVVYQVNLCPVKNELNVMSQFGKFVFVMQHEPFVDENKNCIHFNNLQPSSWAFNLKNQLTDNVGRWTCLVLSQMPVESLCEDWNNKCPVSDVMPSCPLPSKQIPAICGQSWDNSLVTVQQNTKIKNTKSTFILLHVNYPIFLADTIKARGCSTNIFVSI